MKTTTTYPTKHPHWIDEDGYSAPRRGRAGITFATATAIVIAIHVAVIAGVYAYSNSKPKKAAPAAAAVQKEAGPKSDALSGNTWPEPEAPPRVVAKAPPQPAVNTSPKATPAPTQNPVAKINPKPSKPKTGVATAKNPPAVQQGTKTDSRADEELRRQFLAAAGKTVETRPKTVVAAKPEAPPVTAAPKSTGDVAMPVKKAPPMPVAAPTAAVQAPPMRPARAAATHYTLAPGDNLYMVSRKLGVSYNDLAKANGIRDPRQLRVGQTLKVPGDSAM